MGYGWGPFSASAYGAAGGRCGACGAICFRDPLAKGMRWPLRPGRFAGDQQPHNMPSEAGTLVGVLGVVGVGGGGGGFLPWAAEVVVVPEPVFEGDL